MAKNVKRHKLSIVATGEMMKEYKDSKIWCDKHEYNRIKSWKNTLRILFLKDAISSWEWRRVIGWISCDRGQPEFLKFTTIYSKNAYRDDRT